METVVKIIWLTQGGFLICCGALRLAVDPYLSDALAARGLPRLVPSPVELADLHPTHVVCTHDHADHFDPQTMVPLCEMYPACPIIGPARVRTHYLDLGLAAGNLRSLDYGGTYRDTGLTIRAVKACHTDPTAIGLVIGIGGKHIYVSGDTTLEEGLAEQLATEVGEAPDAMLVCINGKLGNMNSAEAASLAARLKPRIVVPMHYGLFAENTCDPAPFAATVAELGLRCVLSEPGRAIEL